MDTETPETVAARKQRFLQMKATWRARATWKPDKTFLECSSCKNKFTLFLKRDVCRQCGIVVCVNCAIQALLPSDPSRPVAVCPPCITKLEKEIAEAANNPANDGEVAPMPGPNGDLPEEKKIAVEAETAGHEPSEATAKVADEKEVESEPTSTETSTPTPAPESTVAEAESVAAPVATPSRLRLMRMRGARSPGLPVTLLEPVMLFNKMSGFGALVVVDTRSPEEYTQGHVPRAISVPISDEDISEERKLAELEKRVGMMDRRGFKMRMRSTLVVVGQAGDRETKDVEGAHEAPKYLAKLLAQEGKAGSVSVIPGGFEHFNSIYPFIACAFKPTETKRHMHKPPFPWYPNEILDSFLYLGDHVHAKNKAHLLHLGISRVLNVSSEIENHHPEDFKYLRFVFPDEDTEDIVQYFPKAFEFLDEARAAGERVLVHCYQGVSRSATILFAYLLRIQGWSLKQTYDFVKNRRKQVLPNVGFWRQLSKYEQDTNNTDTLSECVNIEMMLEELAERRRAQQEHLAKQKAEKEAAAQVAQAEAEKATEAETGAELDAEAAVDEPTEETS